VVWVKNQLMQKFTARDLGPARLFLGFMIERDHNAKTIKLHQKHYTKALLSKFKMEDCKSRHVPMTTGLQLTRDQGKPLDDQGRGLYMELVGALIYLATNTRPDVAYTVSVLSRFNAGPTSENWSVAKALLRYLAGTGGVGLCLDWEPV
jgi:hypothetical protein